MISSVKCVSLSCMSVVWQAGGSTGLLMDLAANEKAVHSDFFNGKNVFRIYTFAPGTISQSTETTWCAHKILRKPWLWLFKDFEDTVYIHLLYLYLYLTCMYTQTHKSMPDEINNILPLFAAVAWKPFVTETLLTWCISSISAMLHVPANEMTSYTI